MSQQVIVFENPEDPTRICIMTPTGEVPIEELLKRHVNKNRPYLVCDSSLFSAPSTSTSPSLDPEFMDAWTLLSSSSSNHTLSVHMPNARNLWRDKLRRERAPFLQALDVEYMRAMETNDATRMQSIAAQKTKLRDMPSDPRIEAAATPEALKQLTLTMLTL